MADVTGDRLRALRRAEERLDLVADHTNEVVLLAPPDFGEVEYVTPAYEDVYGRPAETLYDRPASILEAIHPDDRAAFRADREEVTADVERGEPRDVYEAEYRLSGEGDDPDHDPRWVAVERRPVTDEDGSVERIASVAREVTDRRRFRRTYRELFENASDGLVVHDPDTGEIVDVNRQFCRMNGHDREDLVGETIDAVTASAEGYGYEAAQRRVERAREEGPQLFEWRNRRADGTTFPVEVHLSVVEIEGRERVLASVRDITERKRRERERAEEREKYTTLVEQSHDGIVIVQDGAYAFVNDRFCDLTGRERADLIGRPFHEVMAPEYRDLVRERYEQRVDGERPPRNYDIELETPDGDRVDIELSVSRITHDGAPATMANFRDITERKQKEAELRRVKREYEAVFESARDALFLVDVERPGADGDGASGSADAEFAFRRLNPAHEEKTGLSTEAVRGQTPREALGESLGAATEANYRRCLEAGETVTYEEELDLPAGTAVWQTKLSPVVVDGEVTQIVGIGRDVTERRRLEEQLQERERRFRLIAEHIDEVMYLARADFSEILYINPAYEDVYGRSVESLSENPRSFVEAAHPDDRERYERDVARMIDAIEAGDAADAYEGEYRIRTDGETRWVRITRYPVENEAGTVDRVVGIVREITRRREFERTYRDIFENVSDGLVVHDPEDHRIVDVNERYCDLTGYAREDLVGAGLERVASPGGEYTPERAERLVERVREEGPQLFEWVGERADGTTYTAAVHLSVVEIEGAERVLASVRDVTERKRRERIVRQLHESTDRIQDAGTAAEICDATVEAAEAALDLPIAACWLTEETEGATDGGFEPVAATERTRDLSAGPTALDPARAAETGDGTAVYDPDGPLDRAVAVPLGEHGLLTAGDPDADAYADDVRDAARILARHATTALDRAARERERRESERRLRAILDRIDEAVFLARAADLVDPSPAPEYLSSGYAEIWGRPLAELQATHDAGFFDTLHPDDADAYRAFVEDLVAEVTDGEGADRYTTEYRIERPDGAVRHVRSEFYPLDRGDAPTQVVVVSRDVTDRKERERTLETFHEATRELTEAGSRHEASQRAIDAAEAVLGFPVVSVHLYDDAEGALRPVAETGALERALDFLPSFGPGDGLPWESFVDREAVRRSEADADGGAIYGGGAPDPELVLPLGSHGVMLVGAPDRAFDAETVELAQILAATLEAALNHVEGRRELEQREQELAEHRERADRLERLNTVIREIESATIEATSRDGVEAAVCEQLTTGGPYRAAWIAAPDAAGERLVTRASAGEGATGTAVDLDAAGVERHPAAAALDEGAVRAVRNLATSATQTAWRAAALRAGHQSLAAVPIVHDGTTYGVVTIASDEPTAFDERTQAVLEELGRSVGYTVAVLERQEALESDTTVELEFDVADDGLRVVRLAAKTGATVRLERTVRRAGGALGAFYAVEGADPERVVEAVRGEAGVEEATLVSSDGTTCLVEVVTDSWFGTLFAERGAVVRTATADPEGGTLVVEAPQGADVRALVERFQGQYPETDLTAQRTRDRAVKTLLELQDLLDDGLTPRQREALETAYSAGYFEWPRESSGEEVADLLGVTQPTFNKHLRTAERKTFSMLLDREYPDGSPTR
jgi:PAS domain S-box-containing protein